jgi:putative membrane protein
MMDYNMALHTFLVTLAWTLFGLIVFGIAFAIIVKLTPFSMRKEIEEDQNIALAILVGSVMLGLAIIIAATIHG